MAQVRERVVEAFLDPATIADLDRADIGRGLTVGSEVIGREANLTNGELSLVYIRLMRFQNLIFRD